MASSESSLALAPSRKRAKGDMSFSSSSSVVSSLEALLKMVLGVDTLDARAVEMMQKTAGDIATASLGDQSLADIVTVKTEHKGFECPACTKILKEPIITCFRGGHSFCKRCTNGVKCPICNCKLPSHDVRNSALETIIVDLELAVSCQYHADGCDYEELPKFVEAHEDECRYRKVRCQVLTCYDNIQYQQIEEHMSKAHSNITDKQWTRFTLEAKQVDKYAPICRSIFSVYALKTWRQDSIRFFVMFVRDKGEDPSLFVTATCRKEDAANFRAEIRLGNSDHESSVSFSCPVLSLDSDVLDSDLSNASDNFGCLVLKKTFFERYRKNTTDEILNCYVHRKVIFPICAEDMEEKKMIVAEEAAAESTSAAAAAVAANGK